MTGYYKRLAAFGAIVMVQLGPGAYLAQPHGGNQVLGANVHELKRA